MMSDLEPLNTKKLHRRGSAGQYLVHKYGFGAPATLAKLAVVGGGPPFRKAGRIPLYEEDGLDEWARSRIGALIHSTSEIPSK